MTPNAALNIYPLNENIEIPPMDDQPEPDTRKRREPVIFGLLTACGGTGVTSIAIQMAYHASNLEPEDENLPPYRVALLSLDFENCAISQYLDVKPKVSAEHFCQSPAVMDQQHCLSWMSDSNHGFDVLALPNSVDGNSKVNPNSVIHFLDLAAQRYDVIILDIPRLWTPWTHACVGAADKIGFVMELNIPSLHITRERVSSLVKTVPDVKDPEIILNKFEKRALRNSVSLNDAQKMFLNIPIHPVPASYGKAREALNRGEPLECVHKKSKSAAEINAIFDSWILPHREDAFDLFMANG